MAARKSRYTLPNILRPTVGKLLGLLMAAYFIFTFISIKDQTTVNYYEVEEGSLVKQTGYTGIIIRQEEIITSEASGYIYYYVADGRKVAAGNPVYAIDEGGDLKNYLSSSTGIEASSDPDKIREIRSGLIDYSRSFANTSFSGLYSITDAVEADVLEYASLNIFSNLSEELIGTGISYREFPAVENGTVCCYTDGYEGLTEDDLTAGLFDLTGYQKNVIKAGDLVSVGDTAYKLITSEDWQIAFPISDEEAEELRKSSMITVTFEEKGFSAKVPIRTVYGSGTESYGIIDMSSYLVQFTGDRYIEFDIVTNNESGLKIPDKSITTKDFYVVPIGYLVTDDNGNTGFYKAVITEDGTAAEFIITEIYNTDDEYCYIDCDDSTPLKVGDYVTSATNTDDKYQIELTRPLTGVYNINKGYTIFRKIDEDEIKERANGYTIVDKDAAYGLSIYDHIVLDASTVEDDQLLFR